MPTSLWIPTIVIATVAITIVAFRRIDIFERLLLHNQRVIANGQWWRLLTSALLHADYMHLFVNMWVLWNFGTFLEHNVGGPIAGLVYLAGVVNGSLAGLIGHRDDPDYRAVGASGGVSAMLAAAIVLAPDMPMRVLLVPMAMPAWVFGAFYVAYSVYGARRGGDNIGHEAHLGGVAAGAIAGLLLRMM